MERYSSQGENSFDSVVTLILLAAIWFNLSRRSKDKAVGRKDTTPLPLGRVDVPDISMANKTPAASDVVSPDLLPKIGEMRVIYHLPPWSVVERGQALGRLGNAIISSWIRTSDKRVADYVGIQELSYPEHCFCIEIPEKSELIISPGMVYTIRPS